MEISHRKNSIILCSFNVILLLTMVLVVILHDDHGDVNEPLNYVSMAFNALLFLYTFALILKGDNIEDSQDFTGTLGKIATASFLMVIINVIILKV